MSHRSHSSSPARRRKRTAFSARPARRRPNPWTVVSIVMSVAFVTILVVLSVAGGQGDTALPLDLRSRGKDVELAMATFNDGAARHYRYTTAGGQQITFFVMRSSDGVARAAFDACDVCFRERRGYRQVGDSMVCNSCGKLFRSTDINIVQGGCNPVPLTRTLIGDKLVLKAIDLAQGAAYF